MDQIYSQNSDLIQQYPNQSYMQNTQTSYRFNFQLVEVLLLFVCLLILVVTFVFGIITKNTELRDAQRDNNITQVMAALDNFYNASSNVPSQRAYPIARCSNSLNEVDYEYTLRQSLTGKRNNVTLQTFVNPDLWPVDSRGRYAAEFSKRNLPFRCPNILLENANSYLDNYQSCEFSSNEEKNFCYLYTSSNNGDSYQIGYYSESKDTFVVYSRFRDQGVKRS